MKHHELPIGAAEAVQLAARAPRAQVAGAEGAPPALVAAKARRRQLRCPMVAQRHQAAPAATPAILPHRVPERVGYGRKGNSEPVNLIGELEARLKGSCR